MKKYQRLRFYALVTKKSGGTALDAKESAELKTLSALVALHPSAESDTDETEDEKKKREAEEAKSEETDEEKKEREDKEKEKAKGAKPSLSACIAAAMNGLKGGTSAELMAANKTLTGERDTARADLATANANLATANTALAAANAQLGAFAGFLGITTAEIAGKDAAAVGKILEAKVGAAATEQVASLGFSAAKLPTPSPDAAVGAGTTKAELWATYNSLTGKEQDAFYTKHSKKMLA